MIKFKLLLNLYLSNYNWSCITEFQPTIFNNLIKSFSQYKYAFFKFCLGSVLCIFNFIEEMKFLGSRFTVIVLGSIIKPERREKYFVSNQCLCLLFAIALNQKLPLIRSFKSLTALSYFSCEMILRKCLQYSQCLLVSTVSPRLSTTVRCSPRRHALTNFN